MKQRQIKFRAWVRPTRKEKGEMFNIVMITFPIGGEIILSGKGGSVSAKDCELLQYTGFKDAGDEELYGGDIFEDDACWYKVEWSKDEGAWYAIGIRGNDADISLNEFARSSTCWKQGNIYENKDLLTN